MRKQTEEISSKNTGVDKQPDAPLPTITAPASQAVAGVKSRTAPPQLEQYSMLQKEEELFAMIIAKGRAINRSATDIIEEWKIIKNTLSENNIDLYLAENRLRALAFSNRAGLGIGADAAKTGVQQLLDRLKE